MNPTTLDSITLGLNNAKKIFKKKVKNKKLKKLKNQIFITTALQSNSQLYNRALPSRIRAGLNRKKTASGKQGCTLKNSVWPMASLRAELAEGQACVRYTQVTRVRMDGGVV